MTFSSSRPRILLSALFFVSGIAFAQKGCWPIGDGCLSSGAHDEFKTYAKDKIWGEKIRAGGYILYVRHAQREKWADVTGFDAVELLTTPEAEKSSFKRAVCLTERGVEESKLMGTAFKLADVKVDHVVSSPSCRAKQTAMHAFGRIDAVRNSLLHRTAIMPDQHEAFAKDLRKMIDGLTPKPGSNIVLSAHAGTFRFDKNLLIDVNETGGDPDMREETGFVVLEKKDGKLIARHKFHSISKFANAMLKLPLGDNKIAAR